MSKQLSQSSPTAIATATLSPRRIKQRVISALAALRCKYTCTFQAVVNFLESLYWTDVILVQFERLYGDVDNPRNELRFIVESYDEWDRVSQHLDPLRRGGLCVQLREEGLVGGQLELGHYGQHVLFITEPKRGRYHISVFFPVK